MVSFISLYTYPTRKQLKKSSKNLSWFGNRLSGILLSTGSKFGAITTALPWQPVSRIFFNFGQKPFCTLTCFQQSCVTILLENSDHHVSQHSFFFPECVLVCMYTCCFSASLLCSCLYWKCVVWRRKPRYNRDPGKTSLSDLVTMAIRNVDTGNQTWGHSRKASAL